MGETYLFFDIESANSFGGEGHICSFGYVICDSNFNILEMEDIVMNPRSEFDPGLFSENSRCHLAYTQEEFLSQPDFAFYYERIKNLLTAPGRLNVGFAVENDVGFIVCACHHFGLPQINFHAYDIHYIADNLNNDRKGLSAWLEHYGISMEGLTAHKSSDDAKMTMLLAQKLCQQTKMRPKLFFARNFLSIKTSEDDILRRKKRAYRKLVEERLEAFYNSPNPAKENPLLRGKFKLAFSQHRDYMQVLEICELVFSNGGKLVKKIQPGVTLVVEDDKKRANFSDHPQRGVARYWSMTDLFNKLKMEMPEFKEMDLDNFDGGYFNDEEKTLRAKWMVED